MAALRGPDSSEDERRLGEQAVFPETVDVNIRQLDPIPAPRAFLREQPLTDEMSELVLHSRQEIRDVLNGRDDRLLVIVAPVQSTTRRSRTSTQKSWLPSSASWKTDS